MWAEAMEINRSGDFRLRFSPAMEEYLKTHQMEFLPEDTKAGIIQSYLDGLAATQVCSKQIYAEALGHAFEELRHWEIRKINDIMNNTFTGWKPFSNPRIFGKYGRQKGWERSNGLPATKATEKSKKKFGAKLKAGPTGRKSFFEPVAGLSLFLK